ncbi:hypothetical protein BGY98DRAFT_1055035, partial [Russula aff. rugulosa BPL654]
MSFASLMTYVPFLSLLVFIPARTAIRLNCHVRAQLRRLFAFRFLCFLLPLLASTGP